MQAVEYSTPHKLLFGTDFPFFTARQTMEGLRSVTGDAFGRHLPAIDPDVTPRTLVSASCAFVCGTGTPAFGWAKVRNVL